jgi:hypothetical protein
VLYCLRSGPAVLSGVSQLLAGLVALEPVENQATAYPTSLFLKEAYAALSSECSVPTSIFFHLDHGCCLHSWVFSACWPS